ncbi:hypothetical protein CRYUN_Cryun41cG0006400 [Craigia yunnanensis]
MKLLFSKHLTVTDVQKRLAIPTSCLKHFKFGKDKYSIPLHVLDEDGEGWSFVCSARKNCQYPKPYFNQGWLRFVKSKRMRVGDKVNFYKDVEADVYRIEVDRGIKL